MKITKKRYVEYVISTPINYTCTHLADHLDHISHDAINDYLRREKHTARTVWELAEPLINNSREAYLILDDSVQDKRHSQKIELVKRQYSGNVHGLVKGIGIVNLVHAHEGDYYPLELESRARLYSFTADRMDEREIQSGISVKLKEIPFKAQLFKVIATNGDIDWVITNRPPGLIDTQVVQNENQGRWFIEQPHRELKQLTEIERCQCRKQRAQRNHFACCYHAGFSLKVIAKKSGKYSTGLSTICGAIICVTNSETHASPPTSRPERKS